jgi:hypothetical protein
MSEQFVFPFISEPVVPTLADNLIHLMGILKKFELDIRTALEYGNNSHSFDDVVRMAVLGEVDVYEFPNSVIIMELTKYPNFSVYHGFIATGDLQEILDAHGLMFREAKLRGAKYLSIAGRRGWERAMKQRGWDHRLSILYKEVPDE